MAQKQIFIHKKKVILNELRKIRVKPRWRKNIEIGEVVAKINGVTFKFADNHVFNILGVKIV